jgi:hypothetical protein
VPLSRYQSLNSEPHILWGFLLPEDFWAEGWELGGFGENEVDFEEIHANYLQMSSAHFVPNINSKTLCALCVNLAHFAFKKLFNTKDTKVSQRSQ